MRIAIEQKGLYTYADALVICGKLKYLEGRTDTVTNPSVMVEVLSPATENYDRTTKMELYRNLETLETYVLVDSQPSYGEVQQKGQGQVWQIEAYQDLHDKLRLKMGSDNLELSLTDLYDV